MKGLNDQMNKLRRDFEREKEALMSKHREELERIKFQNSLTMTETKNNYESRISELNLKINQLQETLNNFMIITWRPISIYKQMPTYIIQNVNSYTSITQMFTTPLFGLYYNLL